MNTSSEKEPYISQGGLFHYWIAFTVSKCFLMSNQNLNLYYLNHCSLFVFWSNFEKACYIFFFAIFKYLKRVITSPHSLFFSRPLTYNILLLKLLLSILQFVNVFAKMCLELEIIFQMWSHQYRMQRIKCLYVNM